MKTSLLITTYNWPAALEATLRSVSRQTVMPDEVIVADDGSREDTAVLVQEWASRVPVPLQHVWQEDVGFRLARSRNRAVAAATGDYIIIVDGDMILHPHFVADHREAARPDTFIQGVRLLTKSELAPRLLSGEIDHLGFFAAGIERRRHTVRNALLSRIAFGETQSRKAVRGSNQAYWRADLIRVNGWDENMIGWGREDTELVARFHHSGVKRRNLKFAALTTHIWHKVRKPEGVNPNDVILHRTVAERRTRCDNGLDQHLAEFARGIPESARPPSMRRHHAASVG